MIKRNKAFTLIEILLVVGIMAVGFAGIFGTYKYVKKSQEINDTIELATGVLRKMDDATAAADTFEALANPTSSFGPGVTSWASEAQNTPIPDALYNSGIIPRRYLTPDKYVMTNYGEKVGFNYISTATENVFIMTLANMDPESCVRIGSSMAAYADGVFAQSTTGGGTAAKPVNGTFNREDLQTQCLSSDRANLALIKSKPIDIDP